MPPVSEPPTSPSTSASTAKKPKVPTVVQNSIDPKYFHDTTTGQIFFGHPAKGGRFHGYERGRGPGGRGRGRSALMPKTLGL